MFRNMLLAVAMVGLLTLALAAPAPAEAPSNSWRTVEGRHAVLHAPADLSLGADLPGLLNPEEAFLSRAEKLLGGGSKPRLEVWLYRDREEKGRRTGSTWEESTQSPARIDRILDWQPDYVAECLVLLRQIGSLTGSEALDNGLAIALAGRWQGWELADWARVLAPAELVLAPAELLDRERLHRHSYLYAYAAAGLRAAYLVEHAGAWRTAMARLKQDGLQAWLELSSGPQFVEWLRRLGATARPRAPIPEPPGFQRGICFAHSYTSLGSGYLSRLAADQLRYLRDRVHVNAVSITPFGYLRGADNPEIFHRERVRGASRINEETDDAISAGVASAHRMGQQVLLAPHLWGRVWCGEWGARDAAGWRELFDNYERFILHYAILAELRRVELLSIGKELVRATKGHGEEWRRIIVRVRRVYSGKLTYGANWDAEFEGLEFAGALDLVGLNAYAPLCEGETCDSHSLGRAAASFADRVEKVALRWGKPVLLTEVGFPADTHAAARPWEDGDREGSADPELQAACYQAILNSFGDRPWCAGTYWWKWFTDPALNRSPRRLTDFPPAGKPAETVLARAYAAIAARVIQATPPVASP